ncbi:DMT family transporter [Halostella salina]|uniref:DMT family transporter n=1 Tax=Halostella salina TaxID=1547897 RepID=UPI001F090666|nr:DMT family transporter [Halostella salina]
MTDTRYWGVAPAAAAALWGGMYVVSKWGFARVPPVTLAFLRVALAAVALLVVVRATKPARSFSRRDWLDFAHLGLWVAVTLVTQFVGTDLTNASQGSLLTVLTPVFTLGLGVAFHGERLTGRKVGGMALAAAGTVVVLAGQYDLTALAEGSLAGVSLLLLASLGWAAYTVAGKRLVRTYSALEAATYSTALSVPLIAVLVPVEAATTGASLAAVPLTPAVVAAVLYLGLFSTAAAWYLWYSGLAHADAGSVAVFFFAQPVVGAALGALLLGESLGAGYVIGGAVMAGGIYIVSTARA